MESIGEKLRTFREARKLTIRDIVKETNVSPMYLEALEEEKFDKFPSETYLIGFLRTYAEFLKLDVEAIVQAYKGYKIGESATPLEELTKPTKSSFMIAMSSFTAKYRNYLFIAGVGIAVVLVVWLFGSLFQSGVDMSSSNLKDIKDEYNAKNKGNEILKIDSLQLTNDSGIAMIGKNEAVQFMVDNKEVVFLLKEIKGKSIHLEIIPGNQMEKLDLDIPKIINIKGFPREINLTLKAALQTRANILVSLAQRGEGTPDSEEKTESAVSEQPSGDNTTVVAINRKNLKIVFEADFVQKSFIELYLDGNRKVRGFIPEGTKQRWEAQESIQIKIGNAGGIKARINGKDYNFGGPGQVANKVVTWKKDAANPNLYRISVQDW